MPGGGGGVRGGDDGGGTGDASGASGGAPGPAVESTTVIATVAPGAAGGTYPGAAGRVVSPGLAGAASGTEAVEVEAVDTSRVIITPPPACGKRRGAG